LVLFFSDGRESNVRVRLPRGKYCIIPSTFLPDQEGDFILRVHIERYSREEVHIDVICYTFINNRGSVLEPIFRDRNFV